MHVALHASCSSSLPDTALPTVSVYCQIQPYQLYQFTAQIQPYQLYQFTAQMQPYQLYQFTAQLQSSQLHNAALLTQYPVALLLSPTVDFPSTLLSSVPNAPRCFQPTFTRRTSGRSKETWRAHICLFRRVTVLIVVIIIIIIIVIITATGVMTLW